MQHEIQASPTWAHLAYLAIAGFLGYAIKHGIDYWRFFWKRKQELSHSEAETDKTKAEARSINVKADSEISNIVLRVTTRLEEMQDIVDDIRKERDRYKKLSEKQRTELEFYEHQMKRMKGQMDAKNVHYDDQ